MIMAMNINFIRPPLSCCSLPCGVAVVFIANCFLRVISPSLNRFCPSPKQVANEGSEIREMDSYFSQKVFV